MMQTIREAALRPTAAQLYPFLPAGMWTAAARLSELVARYCGMCAKAGDRANRVLLDAHFVFRGRQIGTGGTPERS